MKKCIISIDAIFIACVLFVGIGTVQNFGNSFFFTGNLGSPNGYLNMILRLCEHIWFYFIWLLICLSIYLALVLIRRFKKWPILGPKPKINIAHMFMISTLPVVFLYIVCVFGAVGFWIT